jgi:subtilase family serine protease
MGVTALVAAPLAAVPASAASPAAVPKSQVAGTRAAWATAAAAVGTTAGSTPLTLTVDLALRDAAGAEALAARVSDPANPEHGAFLTPEAYKARFAASDATVGAVRAYLVAHGATVTEVSPTNRYLRISTTAAAAESMFGVGLKQYRKDGEVLRANDRAVTLPSAIAGAVTAVQGLTEVRLKRAAVPAAPPSPVFLNAGPCSSYYGQKTDYSVPKVAGAYPSYAPCGYVPSQLRSAYDVQSYQSGPLKLDGSGVTVGIVDAYNSPTVLGDANTYATKHGDRPFAAGQLVDLKPAAYTQGYGYKDPVYGEDACGEQGWYGEETLDVEAVHGMAPGAKVVFSGAASCFDDDIDLAVRRIVDGHLASIISNSYGDAGENLDPATIDAEHTTFVQAALEGIGVYFSSGDSGDEVANLGVRTVDYPASDPWVTSVGGTSLAIGADGKRIFETGWSTAKSTLVKGSWTPAPPGAYVYGGGGGVSKLFVQPAYQKGVVPDSISRYFGGAPGRAVPDISAIGDPNTGMLVGQTQTFPNGSTKYAEYRIGGTSLACPVTAGIMALADQLYGHSRGFANYFIYGQSGKASINDPQLATVRRVVRNDFANGVDASGGVITSLRSINVRTTIFVRKGYDDVTGVGEPNGSAFLLAAAGNSTR